MTAVIEQSRFEVVPLKSIDTALAALPTNASVSVTCSPVKGLDETMAITERLVGLGHRPVPHIAARMVRSRAHLEDMTARLGSLGIEEVFVIAGDGEQPIGPYFDAVELVDALVKAGPHIRHIGFAAYPDGHPFIEGGDLSRALHEKARIIADAGLRGHVSTQMCFGPDTIRHWLRTERQNGFALPVHLGIAGVVDRSKLMSMGVRLGVGASLRYLRKNRAAVTKLMAPGSYQPDQLLDPLANDLEPLGITGLHLYTFNQVEATQAWRLAALAG